MTIDASETAIPTVALPRPWHHLDQAILLATKVLVVAVGISFTAMVALEVASRFILDTSMSQTNAIARFLLVWFFMLGAGLALRQSAHVGLDLLRRRVPHPYSAIVYAVAQVLTLTFFAQMLWSGYLALDASRTQVEGSLGVTMAWVMAAFPVGFLLLIYHQVVLVVSTMRLALGKPLPS